MKYAWIEDGVVCNIICLLPTNASDFPCAVFLDGLEVQMGDRYENGMFCRGGERLMTPLQQANMILDELMGGVEDVRQE